MCEDLPMPFDHTDPRWVDEPVVLVPHDPQWPARFAVEAKALLGLIGPWLTGGIHHVGSTAIPGIMAKPVVDVLAGVESLVSSRPCIGLLAEHGWWYAPFRPDTMHWFCKPSPGRRECHLHLVPTGSAWYCDELLFRDYLIAHPQRARAYEELKAGLARTFPDDREAYTQAKAGFIQQVLRDARAEEWSAQSGSPRADVQDGPGVAGGDPSRS
jgi:GrpB-like predicted nucleotidyltransferase (UPF0157 family)